MSMTELTAVARNYKEIQAEIKALQEQADALKQQIITEMDSLQADSLQAGEYTIRYIAYETTRIDTTVLRRELPDLADKYSKTTTALRLTVA